LRRFLFTEERINTKIDQLSGGERSRVLLAKILKRGGNVLMLDEPTNDLDLGTLRLLEEALVAFRGNVIVVSHDRYFLNRVCTAILSFEGDGVVKYAVGNYDYYLEKRSLGAAGTDSGPPPVTRKPTEVSDRGGSKATPRKLKWKEERELEGMEAAILTAEGEVVSWKEFLRRLISMPRTRRTGRSWKSSYGPRGSASLNSTSAGPSLAQSPVPPPDSLGSVPCAKIILRRNNLFPILRALRIRCVRTVDTA
jgi:energy-coupling factor transporter ATP-binding protein EcfA2